MRIRLGSWTLSNLRLRTGLISALAILAVLSVILIAHFTKSDPSKRLMDGVEVNGIRLGMTRQQVQSKFGIGKDDTTGCFGCELNFIYPDAKLSGRYSETLEAPKGKIGTNHNPRVKLLTTADPSSSLLGIHIGDTFRDAARALENQGFALVSADERYHENYYSLNDLYVRFWSDDHINFHDKDIQHKGSDDEIVRSITVERRVKADEEITY
jgi:hypothetical protein